MAETFNIFLIVMAVLAAGVYVALHFFEAGYGYLFNPKYGPPVPNKVGWVVMESPVFIAMCVLWLMSGRVDLLRLARRLLSRLVRKALHLRRGSPVHGGDGRKPPFRPYHPQPA